VADGKIFATCALDDMNVKLSVKLPCLISVDGDINTPRLPSYKTRKTIKEGDVKFFSFADFEDQDESHYGLTGSATQVERIFPPEKNVSKHNVCGNADEQAAQLYALLRAQKLV
jgi:electron transfer flavoprotein beta subunit